ncbi:MAG: four helix bundle protein [Saprospiraceae bacterium]
MKNNNIIQEKSFDFAVKIVELYKYLVYEKKEYVLSKQILRSGTSIGANVEEAIGGQSNKDFVHKISIAYKEARETHYWIRLLIKTRFIDEKIKLIDDLEEILRILGSIQKTLKEKILNS